MHVDDGRAKKPPFGDSAAADADAIFSLQLHFARIRTPSAD